SQPHRAAELDILPGIVATARELIACINAGDFNRQIALYVEVRDRDELEALVDSLNSPPSEEFPQTPEVLPTTMPNRPADETATQGVAATARQLVACINTGDLLRVSALSTDDFLRSVTSEPLTMGAWVRWLCSTIPFSPGRSSRSFCSSSRMAIIG
ncbi:MAG: hypothetical protein QOG89_1313, partial [Thermomicrobiales bacterium]|nr:hypothetical protein [Thermomicrobiales bacterium]